MKRLILLFLLLPSVAFAQGFGLLNADKAVQIKTNTNTFGNFLPSSATTVQSALDYINANAGSSSGSSFWVAGAVGINTTSVVGIGTTNPTALLNINTSDNSQDLFRVDDTAGSDATPFIIRADGNVGIGSATPSAVLAISSTLNQSLFRVDDNGTGDLSPFLIDANGNVGIGTSNTERDKLLVMGGNVGIGTWVPSTLLDVSGVIVTAGLVSTANVGIGTIAPIAPLQVKPVGAFASGTGGTITTYTSVGITYKVHTFTTSGTFVAPQPATNVNVLVIGGGGGGGGNGGGGGGAGGYQANTSYATTSAQSITVTVGAAGTVSNGNQGNNGGDSVFGTITATGGGGGGANFIDGSNGGSGGGQGRSTSVHGTGVVGQGNNGGDRSGTDFGAGGGASAVGGNGSGSGTGGAGGAGTANSITGSSVTYACGGGGGSNGTGGAAGCSSGGHGGDGSGSGATAGAANTGGGGGGVGSSVTGLGNQVGGSGVVIVSYVFQSASTAGIFNGSIGINNNSPTALLDVVGAGNSSATQSLNIKDTNSRSMFRIDDSGNIGIGTDMSGQVGVFTVWGGNVGIGTKTPGQVLDVLGNARLAGANSLYLGTDAKAYISATAATTSDVTINTNSLERIRIANGGNVGLSSTTPGAALDVQGTVRGISGGTCTTLYKCQGGVDAGVIQTVSCVLCPASTCVAMNACF